MKTTLIDKIKSDLLKEGLPLRTQSSRRWLNSKMRQLKGTAVSPILDNPQKSKLKTRIEIGKMYFFVYDPKHKQTLPYYDMFPLVFPVEPYSDGFLGINLHYIDPSSRIRLLDKLYSIASNQSFDSKTKLKISYSVLSNSLRFFESTPCIKRYLYSQLDSPFMEVSSDEWEIAALLPVSGFVKSSDNKVWKQSRKKF